MSEYFGFHSLGTTSKYLISPGLYGTARCRTRLSLVPVLARSLGDLDQHRFIFRIGQEPLTSTFLRFRAVQILSTSFGALRERAIAAWNPIELEELWITCHEGAPASIKQRGLPLLKMCEFNLSRALRQIW